MWSLLNVESFDPVQLTLNFLLPNSPVHTNKYGGWSVTLWTCFCSKGPGKLVKVRNIVYTLKWEDILNKKSRSHCEEKLKISPQWVFEQDEYPKHFGGSSHKLFTRHKIQHLWRASLRVLKPKACELSWREETPRTHDLESSLSIFPWKIGAYKQPS